MRGGGATDIGLHGSIRILRHPNAFWGSCADISSWPVGRSAQRLDLPEVSMSDPLEGLPAEARMGSSAPR